MSSDAYHMTGMAPEGEGCRRAMNAALKAAGLSPDKIDYVNAHATGTPVGDSLESKAIENVFGERALNHTLLVSSTKSMTGHLLGGAGGLEAGITILAMQHQIAPPTMNLDQADPVCRLNYVPNKPQAAMIDYALSNSLASVAPTARSSSAARQSNHRWSSHKKRTAQPWLGCSHRCLSH